MSLIHNGKVSLANVGDSCGFIMKDNGYMEKVTVDQNAERQDEINRIIESNGLITNKNGVSRIYGSIAVSRAIGDKPYKKFLIPEPECTHYQLQ